MYLNNQREIVECIIESINSNYADYCFTDTQLKLVTERLKEEGKKSILCYPIYKEGEFSYYHLLPVTAYIKSRHTESEIIDIFDSNSNLFNLKLEFLNKHGKVILKNYNKDIDQIQLSAALYYTNKKNL